MKQTRLHQSKDENVFNFHSRLHGCFVLRNVKQCNGLKINCSIAADKQVINSTKKRARVRIRHDFGLLCQGRGETSFFRGWGWLQRGKNPVTGFSRRGKRILACASILSGDALNIHGNISSQRAFSRFSSLSAL